MNPTKKGDAYLCYVDGEDESPVAAIVHDLEGVRQFLVAEVYGEDNDEVQAIIDELGERDWYEGGPYEEIYEIGRLEIKDVFAIRLEGVE